MMTKFSLCSKAFEISILKLFEIAC